MDSRSSLIRVHTSACVLKLVCDVNNWMQQTTLAEDTFICIASQQVKDSFVANMYKSIYNYYLIWMFYHERDN